MLKLNQFARTFLYPKGILHLWVGLALFMMTIMCAATVYFTGGTYFSYVHLSYLPILLMAIAYNIPGGILTGILMGFVMGPMMPAKVTPLVLQSIDSWSLRLLFFAFFGGITGIGTQLLKSSLRDLKRSISTDSTTNLPNLRGLIEHFEKMNKGTSPRSPYSIILIQIDLLSHISEALGPHSAESLLKAARDKINTCSPRDTFLSALEPGVFCLFISNDTLVPQMIERLKLALKQKLMVDEIPFFLNCFYGVAFGRGRSLVNTIRKAKVALSKARKYNTELSIYNEEDDQVIQKNFQLVHDLHQTLLEDGLVLHYQPKINIENLEVNGLEALVRWRHPKFGPIPPQQFISLIENTLLINDFTRWIIKCGIKQLASWHAAGLKLSLALNFSVRNFQDSGVLTTLEKTLKEYNVSPKFLEIEVTESSIATDLKKVADVLASMRQSGIKIAIDDYGTGQSSMQYLFELPVDVLKIDKTFIQQITQNSAAEAIVRSTILLAKELHLSVVAEGIEFEEEYEQLRHLGCPQGQGYYFAKPMPADFVTQWIQAKKIGAAKSQLS